MEQEGAPEALRRNEAGEALATLSMHDPYFLTGIRTDLESTLWRYGFALSPREMQTARDYLTENTELSDEEFIQNVRVLEAFRRW